MSGTISRRSVIGAAATAAVAGSSLARLFQVAGQQRYDELGGLGLVVAQHDLRVDHVRLGRIAGAASPSGAAGSAGAAAGIDPFVAIGFSVPDDTDLTLLPACSMRTRGADGWSDWGPIPFALDEGPDGAEAAGTRRLASQPYWVGFGDGFEVDLPEGLADVVAVHLVRETPTVLAHHSDVIPAYTSLAQQPRIGRRSEWNARPPKVRLSFERQLKMAIVHHTVDRNGYAAGEVPGMLLATQRYHMDVNGWNDIAYNFLVDRFGRAWEGRSGGITKLAVGGHAAGFNTGNTGISAIGDYHLDSSYSRGTQPSGAMVDCYERLIAWKLGIHGVDPTGTVKYTAGYGSKSSRYPEGTTGTFARVVGHTDVGATACPGSQLHPKIRGIRTAAKGLQGGFRDVAGDAYYAAAVGWMVKSGIVSSPEKHRWFRPNEVVDRKLMAAWLWKLMDSPKRNPPHGFTDIPKDATYAEAVRWLKAEGITEGYGAPGKFSPDAAVTRAQMAAFLWRLAGERTGYPRHHFRDVPRGAYYDKAVKWLKATGITTGVGGGNEFAPEQRITRAELSTFLYRLAGKKAAWTLDARTPKPSTVRF